MQEPIVLKLKDFRHQYMALKERKDRDFFIFDGKQYHVRVQHPTFNVMEKIERVMFYPDDCHWIVFVNDVHSTDYHSVDFDNGFNKFEHLYVHIYQPFPPVIRTNISSTNSSCVYFIGSKELDYIKIGRSIDVRKRLKGAKTFNPNLKLYGMIENGVEKELKEQFAHINIKNSEGKKTECFTKTQELKDFILNLEYSRPSLLIQEILDNRQELIN